MIVKVLCPCGARFEFEVEPVDGQMPVALACPDCGGDATALANAVIRDKLGVPKPKAGPVRVTVGAARPGPEAIQQPLPPASRAGTEPPPGAPPASAAASVLEAASPAADTPEPQRCPKHPQELAVAECHVCHKPICSQCMEMFGWVCSVYCQERASAQGIEVPAYERQKRRVEAVERSKSNRLLVLAAVAAALVVVAWGWYALVGSKPRPAFSLKTEGNRPFLLARWVGNDRVAVLSTLNLALHEAGSGNEVWSVPLKPDEVVKRGPQDPLDESDGFSPRMQVRNEDVWLVFAQRAVRVDARAGKREQEIPINPPADEASVDENSLLLISTPSPVQKTLSRIDLGSRRLQTETITVPAPRGVTTTLLGPQPVLRASDHMRALRDSDDIDVELRDNVSEFMTTGPNAVHLTVKLLEPRIVTPEVARAEAEKSTMLDRPLLRAVDSAQAVGEFLRNTRETGPGKVDQSKYRVTLRRLFASGASEWTEQVIGPPAFFALKSVDLFTAGTALVVFDKNGKKLWEAKLMYPISPRFMEPRGADADAPGLEAGGRLYFFDQGMLTSFELRSGQVQWRLPNVGISQVLLPSGGRLYVAGTTAAPALIPTHKVIAFSEAVHPLLLQVDAGNGKVLWQLENVGERFHVGGKFVYTSRTQVSRLETMAAAMNQDDSPTPVHHRIYRLDPGKGKELWEYYRPKAPVFLEARHNRLLLQFPREVQVLKFLSL